MYIDKPFLHSISISPFSSAMTEVEVFIIMTVRFITTDRDIRFQGKYITFNNNWWYACLQIPEWSSLSLKMMGNLSANSFIFFKHVIQ